VSRRRTVEVFPCLEHGRLVCPTCDRRLSQLRASAAPRVPLTQALGPKLVRHLEALTSRSLTPEEGVKP
jgi:hypothetical protein